MSYVLDSNNNKSKYLHVWLRFLQFNGFPVCWSFITLNLSSPLWSWGIGVKEKREKIKDKPFFFLTVVWGVKKVMKQTIIQTTSLFYKPTKDGKNEDL